MKAAGTAEGPVYVQCHYGKHRGPAAAALICQGVANWNPQEAVAWLQVAGTSPDYPQLFQKTLNFKKPAVQELAVVSADFLREQKYRTWLKAW